MSLIPDEVELVDYAVNGVSLHVATAGPKDGPLVILVHGWPESWFSWRFQIPVLAAAGWRVLAPDMRGYGKSSAPRDVEAYDMQSMMADLVGLIDAEGQKQAVLVGHDWGAPIVWQTSIIHRDRIRAVAGLSIPHMARQDVPQTQLFNALYKDRFFYINWFQTREEPEQELEEDVDASLRYIYAALAGVTGGAIWDDRNSDRQSLLDGMFIPDDVPAFLSEDEFQVYVDQFAGSGFHGPLNRYRNFERDWKALPALSIERVTQPSAYIVGNRDLVLRSVPGRNMLDFADTWCDDLRVKVVIPEVGHWTQQEGPAETNRALLEFLGGL